MLYIADGTLLCVYVQRWLYLLDWAVYMAYGRDPAGRRARPIVSNWPQRHAGQHFDFITSIYSCYIERERRER